MDDIFDIILKNQECNNIVKKYGTLFNVRIPYNATNDDFKHLKGIHNITIPENSNMTNRGFGYLSEGFCGFQGFFGLFGSKKSKPERNLYLISIILNKYITDTGLNYLSGMHAINIGLNEHITDRGLKFIKGAERHKCDVSLREVR